MDEGVHDAAAPALAGGGDALQNPRRDFDAHNSGAVPHTAE